MNSPSRPAGAPKVVLAVEDRALRSRVLGLLQAQGIEAELVDLECGGLSKGLESDSTDAVVVSRAQLSDDQVSLLDERADKDVPGLIVLDKEEDAKDRARLLASGASAVLDAKATNTDLGDELATIARAEAEGGLDGPEIGGGDIEPDLADFHSRSPRMKDFVDLVRRVAKSDTSLLICGETGVGKERLARAIHNETSRSDKPFVSVNCGALPENLLESELFGHEAGAFTGANERRPGRFEQANGGTILLDEIGEMPAHLQVNLLTVLQRREVNRLGGKAPISIDVRVLAATNRDLQDDIRSGRFREDLFYRLNVVYLEIPPLRERREDLPDLIGRFLLHFRSALQREELTELTEEAMQALLRYSWPGNVRELINVLERAMLLARGEKITLQDLPPSVKGASQTQVELSAGGPFIACSEDVADLEFQEAKKKAIAGFETWYLRRILSRFNGNVGESAAHANINVRTLYEKLRRHGIQKEDYKP